MKFAFYLKNNLRDEHVKYQNGISERLKDNKEHRMDDRKMKSEAEILLDQKKYNPVRKVFI